MKHILSRLLAASLFAFGFSAFAAIDNPKKIGIGTWEYNSSDNALRAVEQYGFGWYYDWRTTQLWGTTTSPVRHVPFVPMIWDETRVNETAPSASGVLLGFNEPDNAAQANMTVEQAISLWPKLMATGLRLGSPAPTTEQALGANSWLGRFMTQAQSNGYRVDFVAVHYYRANKDVSAFKEFLEAVYNAYQRPIWVTEWGLVDWSNPGRYSIEENAVFAQQALEMLDDLPFVERHAWFASYDSGEGINTKLFDSNNNATAIGQVFYQALRGSTGMVSNLGANIVTNPGFEAGDTYWTNWGTSSIVQSDAASGQFSLRVGTTFGGRAQRVSVSATKSYRLTASAKGQNGYVGITFRNSSGKIVKQFAAGVNSTSYVNVMLDVVAPRSFSYAEVWVVKNGDDAYLYVDDFALVPL